MSYMIENLEYRFREDEDKRRAGLFEIDAPKVFIDGVTSAYGPMLTEVRTTPAQSILQRTYDGDGGVNLWFDLDMLGRGWKGQPADRAVRVLAMAAQIDAVANLQGIGDPRIRFTAPFVRYAPDDFGVSFTQPQGDERVTATRIEDGMLRAAALLRMNPTKVDDRAHIRAVYSNENGLSLRTRRDSRGDVLSTDPDATPKNGRIEMIGNSYYTDDRKEAQARLIALIGIISALDPIRSPEN